MTIAPNRMTAESMAHTPPRFKVARTIPPGRAFSQCKRCDVAHVVPQPQDVTEAGLGEQRRELAVDVFADLRLAKQPLAQPASSLSPAPL